VFKNAVIILAVAIVFAGCSTSKPPEKVVEPDEGKAAPELNWNSPAQKSVASQPSRTMISSNQSTAVQKNSTLLTTWIPLSQWAAEHGLKPPRLFASSPEAAYSINSANGTMILAIGSREVTWNGITVNLGYAPELIDGEIYLYGIDLQKNLEPLLCEPPISFPPDRRVIVIDPGHGGSNVGTHSVLDGRFEKEFTLDTALRLKPLLETNGWTVFLTRTADVDFANSNRVTFAEAHHADLYISLHFNATADRSQNSSGIETYCMTPTGLPSTLTRGYSDPLFAHLPNNDFDTQNLQLAVKLQSALVRATGLDDRGVCRARFMTVLQGQRRPAILIENGYFSNPHDAKLIESPEFRQKLAETIADALSAKSEDGK
jgi:N-acetylmuramoyl-L-alanine amidase